MTPVFRRLAALAPKDEIALVGQDDSPLQVALAITRLVVAHRPETLRAAGRVVSLEGGMAREQVPSAPDLAPQVADESTPAEVTGHA